MFASLVSTKFHYFKIVPPASPYIIIPPGGIIIYELAGGTISKKRNVVDPILSICGAYMIWLVYLKKLCGMFCRV